MPASVSAASRSAEVSAQVVAHAHNVPPPTGVQVPVVDAKPKSGEEVAVDVGSMNH